MGAYVPNVSLPMKVWYQISMIIARRDDISRLLFTKHPPRPRLPITTKSYANFASQPVHH
eukprot:scaffold202191_cov28-Tisochrysis_lutea.AAC.1